MNFYINKVDLPGSDWNHTYIGLFTKNKWSGEGHFCGWYGGEFYHKTTLLAYGIQEGPTGVFDAKRPFNGGFHRNVNQYFKKVSIGSKFWEICFEADNVEEALDIFEKQEWDKERNEIER